MISQNALISIAMLKVDKDHRQQDYLSYLIPFVCEALDAISQNTASPIEVSQLIFNKRSINIPPSVVETALKRLAKQKYLSLQDGLFQKIKPFPPNSLVSNFNSAEREIRIISDSFLKFANEDHSVEFDEETALMALTGFFRTFSIDCLRHFTNGTILPEVDNVGAGENILVSEFILKASAKADNSYGYLKNLMKAVLLSNSLVCDDLNSIQTNFRNVIFYFDTKILLRILGLDGEIAKRSSLDLFGLLRKLKGKCGVFTHTIREIRSVLINAENNISQPNAGGSVLRELRRCGKTASDVLLLRGKFESNLRKLGFEILPTPKVTPAFNISYDDLERLYRKYAPDIKDKPLFHDQECVRSIYELRSGTAPMSLEQANSVFVTSNSALARSAYEYGQSFSSSKEVSTVITDHSLINQAWLKAPLDCEDISEHQLIATAYAAMNPPEELWSAYVREVDELLKDESISEDDHAFLRYSIEAEAELMSMTLGSADELYGLNVINLLEKAKQRIAQEKDAQILKEKGSHSLTKLKVNKLEDDLMDERRKFNRIARKLGDLFGSLAFLLHLIVIGLGAILSSFVAYNITIGAVGIIFLVLTIWFSFFSTGFNFSPEKSRRVVSSYIERKIATMFE